MVVSIYHRIRALGFGEGEALVTAYKHYLSVCGESHRISFDRGFDLVSHTEGIWVARTASFTLTPCRACACEFLAALGERSVGDSQCPFCRLVKRYLGDPRVQACFRVRALPDLRSLD